MDPYMVLSSRILHEERIAAVTRRNKLTLGAPARPEPGSGLRALVARLLSGVRPRERRLEKRTTS